MTEPTEISEAQRPRFANDLANVLVHRERRYAVVWLMPLRDMTTPKASAIFPR
jgi:hypothetical protein